MKKLAFVLIAVSVIFIGVQAGLAESGGRSTQRIVSPNIGVQNLTDEQKAKLLEIHQQFYKELNDIREQLLNKRYELSKLYLKENPDQKKIEKLYEEIRILRAKFYDLKIQQRQMIKDIIGNTQYPGRGYGFGCGGPGFGARGFGGCWSY